MFFGLDWDKLVLLLIVAALLVGPERLPQYAETLAKFTVRAREWLSGAKTRVKEELGDDFDDVEWRRLDPRQYDPRRIIRDALLSEDEPVAPEPAPVNAASGTAAASVGAVAAGGAAAVGGASRPSWASSAVPVPSVVGPVPFDGEAT